MRVPFSSTFSVVFLALGSLLVTGSVTLPAMAMQAPAVATLDGTWQGAVRQPDGSDNRWVVKIEKVATGWKGTLWYIDQKSPPIPIDKVVWNGGTLDLDIQRTGITYEGKWRRTVLPSPVRVRQATTRRR